MSLDLKSIFRLKKTVFLLTFVPGCTVEASVVAVISYFILGSCFFDLIIIQSSIKVSSVFKFDYTEFFYFDHVNNQL